VDARHALYLNLELVCRGTWSSGYRQSRQSVLATEEGGELQNRARGEHKIEVAVLHDDAVESQLQQVGERDAVRENGGVWELPRVEEQTVEGGAAEERGGEAQAMKGKGAVDEDEFIDALGGEVHKPARELGAVRVNDLYEAVGEADEGEGAWVHAEDGVDGVRDGGRDVATARQEVGVGEHERVVILSLHAVKFEVKSRL
jgi:hypothetical protein